MPHNYAQIVHHNQIMRNNYTRHKKTRHSSGFFIVVYYLYLSGNFAQLHVFYHNITKFRTTDFFRTINQTREVKCHTLG